MSTTEPSQFLFASSFSRGRGTSGSGFLLRVLVFFFFLLLVLYGISVSFFRLFFFVWHVICLL
jgi:hypothetical protein